MDIAVVRPSDVDGSDAAAWTRLRASDPRFASPYFSLAWLTVLERAGARIQIALAREDGALRAVLAVQGPASGIARPAGGPMSDVHGLVCAPGDRGVALAMVRALGAGVFAAPNLVADQAVSFAVAGDAHGYAVMDVAEGYEAWFERRKAMRAKAFRNIRSRLNKLEREGRTLEFVFDDDDPDAFEQLIAWKRDQMRRADHPDLYAQPWAKGVLERLRAGEGESVRGVLSTMRIDGALAAAHFGMREGGVLHHWLPGFDDAYRGYSPGHVLLLRMAEAGAADGITEIHLAAGAYPYKDDFCDLAWPLVDGAGLTASPVAQAWRAASTLERMGGDGQLGRLVSIPARALRRLNRTAGYRGA